MVGGLDASRSLTGSIAVWPPDQRTRPWWKRGSFSAIPVTPGKKLHETDLCQSLANLPPPFISSPENWAQKLLWWYVCVYFDLSLMQSKGLHVGLKWHKWRKPLILGHFRKWSNDLGSHRPLLGQCSKQRTSATQETKRYQSSGVLPVSPRPSADFEVQTVLCLRDLSICFPLKSPGPLPCIYQNLQGV